MPILDFRAADLGVMLPLMLCVVSSSVFFVQFAAASVCIPRLGGPGEAALPAAASLGVKGLLVCRKAALRLGVTGLA